MPKNIYDNSNFLNENEVDYYEEDDYEMMNEEENFDDFSDIETLEEYSEKDDYKSESQNLPINKSNQSVLKAILLSLIGKQSEYTSIDRKLQSKSSKIVFMIASLMLLIIIFAALLFIKR